MPAIHRRLGIGRIVVSGAGSILHLPAAGLRVSGTPLGLLPNVSYNRTIIKPDPGDLIVLYSDGVSEATNPAGTEFGRDNLMTVARALNPSSAETFGLQLVEAVGAFRGERAPEDDETLIVLQAFPDSLALT